MKTRRTPWWVWGLCFAIALVEPVTHVALRFGMPEDLAFSGSHIGDNACFLPGMGMLTNDFFSPYAGFAPGGGAWGCHYFSLPLHWVYGIVGWLGTQLGIEAFLFLGLANGLCGFLYLWAVYRFLRVMAPQYANLAFLMFAFSGGLGGVLYLLCLAFGLNAAPGFEVMFHRYARYELIEGPFLSPVLVMPRLYYTLALALGFLAVTRAVRRGVTLRLSAHGPALLAFLALSCINARLGPLFWFVLAVHVALLATESRRVRAKLLLMYAAPVLTGLLLTFFMARWNPPVADGHLELLARSIWFGSLLSMTCWHLIAVPPALRQGFAALPRWGRVVVGSGLGYLAAFAVLYALHQTYYGSWLARGDAAAAVAISDWAFIGALPGALLGALRRSGSAMEPTLARMVLWVVPLCAVGVSAAGGGVLLRLMPERLLVLVPVPLAILGAAGIRSWQVRFPRLGKGLLATMVGCGLCSALVASLCFQAPLGFRPGRDPFQFVHAEGITPFEREMIDAIDGGVVVAPASMPFLGDATVLLRPGTRTVFGQGAFDYGDRPLSTALGEVRAFFAEGEPVRAALAREWKLDYIICPEAHPLDGWVVDELAGYPWTETVLRRGDAGLFRVVRDE